MQTQQVMGFIYNVWLKLPMSNAKTFQVKSNKRLFIAYQKKSNKRRCRGDY